MKTYDICFPEKHIQKIFMLETPGGEPAGLSAVIPTVTETSKPFDVRIAVYDANGYPSLKCNSEALIKSETTGKEMAAIKFNKGLPAIATVKNAVSPKSGFFRIAVCFNGRNFYSNPSLCEKHPRYRIFWGDPHVHTVLSDCHPDLCHSSMFAYAAARYLTGLDWISVTDHVSNGRGTTGKWLENKAAAELYNCPFEFITLPAYEASLKGGAGGDNNVYLSKFPDCFVDEYEHGTLKTLCEKLWAKSVEQGFDFFVVPHHTSRSGKHGEMPENVYPGKDLMPAVEIYSKWGSSEYYGNPHSLLQPHRGESYIVDYLKKGFAVGFIAGTDTHSTMPSNKGREPSHIPYKPGFTAVCSNSLTRENVFNAIKARKTYASGGNRIFLEFNVDGFSQGEIARRSRNEPRHICVRAAASADIREIEFIRNGKVIKSVSVNKWTARIEFTDGDDIKNICLESKNMGSFFFYYVRVRCDGDSQAWSSPVFFTL